HSAPHTLLRPQQACATTCAASAVVRQAIFYRLPIPTSAPYPTNPSVTTRFFIQEHAGESLPLNRSANRHGSEKKDSHLDPPDHHSHPYGVAVNKPSTDSLGRNEISLISAVPKPWKLGAAGNL